MKKIEIVANNSYKKFIESHIILRYLGKQRERERQKERWIK